MKFSLVVVLAHARTLPRSLLEPIDIWIPPVHDLPSMPLPGGSLFVDYVELNRRLTAQPSPPDCLALWNSLRVVPLPPDVTFVAQMEGHGCGPCDDTASTLAWHRSHFWVARRGRGCGGEAENIHLNPVEVEAPDGKNGGFPTVVR